MSRARVQVMLLGLFAVLLCGCQPKTLYYWGDYSNSYYEYMKSPSEETLTEHLASIENIIKMSKRTNRAVPPGVYGEYGYFKLKAGKLDEAVSLFKEEKKLYPESHVFMDRLIASATERQSAADDIADGSGQESDKGENNATE